MSGRARLVFVMPAEFAELLKTTTEALGEHVVLYLEQEERLEHWNGSEKALLAASWVYLTGEPPDLNHLRDDDVIPGQLGWMRSFVPRIENSCLHMIQIDAKGDWYDDVQHQVLKSPVALKRFDRFWRKWKVHFHFSVVGRNLKLGGEAVYPNIGYSPGAEAWFRSGGELCKEVTANSRFFLPDPPA